MTADISEAVVAFTQRGPLADRRKRDTLAIGRSAGQPSRIGAGWVGGVVD